MSDSVWQRLWRGTRRIWARPDWHRLAGPGWEERILAQPVTDRFHAKQGRSTGRWILHSEGARLTVYLKRHYRLPWWSGLLAAFSPQRDWSPAMQEWRHLEWARKKGIPVPAVASVGEFAGPGWKLQSFLAVDELTDMLPLHEAIPRAAAFLPASEFEVWKRGLVRELARLARSFHERRHFHQDFYLCHFYIASKWTEQIPEWQGQVTVIDLHRLSRHRVFSWIWQGKDLAQLLYSSEIPGIDASDRLRFWHAYWGAARRSWSAAFLKAWVLLKWKLYRRHHRRRADREGRRRSGQGWKNHSVNEPAGAQQPVA